VVTLRSSAESLALVLSGPAGSNQIDGVLIQQSPPAMLSLSLLNAKMQDLSALKQGTAHHQRVAVEVMRNQRLVGFAWQASIWSLGLRAAGDRSRYCEYEELICVHHDATQPSMEPVRLGHHRDLRDGPDER